MLLQKIIQLKLTISRVVSLSGKGTSSIQIPEDDHWMKILIRIVLMVFQSFLILLFMCYTVTVTAM